MRRVPARRRQGGGVDDVHQLARRVRAGRAGRPRHPDQLDTSGATSPQRAEHGRAEVVPMMTVITYITLNKGSEPEWDAAMRERLENARHQAGWVRGQVL